MGNHPSKATALYGIAEVEEEDGQIIRKRNLATASNQMVGSSEALGRAGYGEHRVEERQKADFKNYGLEEWPNELFTHPNLNFIDASHNRLRKITDKISGFKKLRRLAIGTNDLTEIPDAIGELTELTWFDFTHNQVHTISPAITKCVNLASLGASDCRLTLFPLSFCELTNLKKLGVFNNLINSLPTQIGNLVQLTKLDLSGNALSVLPKEIGKLKELTWLNLSKNMLIDLPQELGQLTKLKELGLSFNKLKALPNLSSLKELTILPVYNNDLEDLGDWIAEMTSLTKLDLSFNKLAKLPDNIFALPALVFVNFRRNLLTELPPVNRQNLSARSMTLQSVDIRDNLLKYIPISLLGVSNIEFKAAGNPFMNEFVPTKPHATTLSLKELALNQILMNRHLVHTHFTTPLAQFEMISALQSGKICESCKMHYLDSMGFQDFMFIQVGDVECAPFLAETCSVQCLARYSESLIGAPSFNPRSEIQSPTMMQQSMSIDALERQH